MTIDLSEEMRSANQTADDHKDIHYSVACTNVNGSGFMIISTESVGGEDYLVHFLRNGQPVEEFNCAVSGRTLSNEEAKDVLTILKTTLGRMPNSLPHGTIERLEASVRNADGTNAKGWSWCLNKG